MSSYVNSLKFHQHCGDSVVISNNGLTATRKNAHCCFNNGLAFTSVPLCDNQLLEVTIDSCVDVWNGNIQIGVTVADPETIELAQSGTQLKCGTWVLVDNSVIVDGQVLNESYSVSTDKLGVNDRVGVMKTSQGDLIFFVNGVSHGIAANDLPVKVYGMVDLFGKCSQVTICDNSDQEARLLTNERANEAMAANVVFQDSEGLIEGRVRFHERCGSLVKLTNNQFTAERLRPIEEFNNGVVMTNRYLRDNELFEIKIEELVDKWSGSIEVGITTHDPSKIDFPATMTNMRSGTTMMSGCGILTNGKGTRREYGNFNLDDLAIGDRIALTRKSNGDLHFYVNGSDQGVAATNVPSPVWGVVDLYGRTVKVTLIDSLSGELVHTPEQDPYLLSDDEDPERQLFYPRCGSHVTVINEGKTAYRPNALEDFNNGVVLTARPLKVNELFEVKLDKIVTKWAGSIEIGVTTHHPNDLEYPSTMTNIRSGTWMMTGKGIMQNGSTIIDNYGSNLDCLKVNDRVGVRRTENGTLHFYVNGIDQGVAATNVPDKVYGVVDLYGQAAEATIVDNIEELTSPDAMNSSLSTSTLYRILHMKSDLRFGIIHGKNSYVYNSGLTAQRFNAYSEYEGAIVMSNRPLREDEKFEITLDRIIEGWKGSIIFGVTLHKPEEIEQLSSVRELKQNTWYLQGSELISSTVITTDWGYNLDHLRCGTVLGIRRQLNGSVCISIDDDDKGAVFHNVPSGVYVIIDIYGRCSKISVAHNPQINENCGSGPGLSESTQITMPIISGTLHRFSSCHSKSITLYNKNTFATRSTLYSSGLVFSSYPLEVDELFQVSIEQKLEHWAGSLKIGVVNMSLREEMVAPQSLSVVGSEVWFVSGSNVVCDRKIIKYNYCPNLDRLSIGDCIGIKVCCDGTLRYYLNGKDMGVAAWNLPRVLFAVIDLYGSTRTLAITSSKGTSVFKDIGLSLVPSLSGSFHGCSDLDEDYKHTEDDKTKQEFHENSGKNILVYVINQRARRLNGYNHGIVFLKKPIVRDKLYQIRIDKLNTKWCSSLMIGLISVCPDKLALPACALDLRRNAWIICGDSVYHNAFKLQAKYGPHLDHLTVKSTVGILVDNDNALHLYINNIDQGVAAKDLPALCYVVIDLYGQCEEISLIYNEDVPIVEDGCDVPVKVKPDPNFCSVSSSFKVHRNCEYKNACIRGNNYLALPAGFFVPDQSMCFCDMCHKMRMEQPYLQQGDPPRDYGLPLGWCRFPLKLPSSSNSTNALENWHMAFHRCRISSVRRILDCGELVLPDDLDLCKMILAGNKVKNDCENNKIVLSPSIKYSEVSSLLSQEEFVDPVSGKLCGISVGFQVYIQPGSYKVGPSNPDLPSVIDGHLNPDSMEWTTKERGNTILYALIIKITSL